MNPNLEFQSKTPKATRVGPYQNLLSESDCIVPKPKPKRTLTVDAFTTSNMTQAQTTAATLDNLMTHDAATGGNKALDKAWHGAEACHFWLLAHRHLYDGQTDLALKVRLTRLTANAANG